MNTCMGSRGQADVLAVVLSAFGSDFVYYIFHIPSKMNVEIYTTVNVLNLTLVTNV